MGVPEEKLEWATREIIDAIETWKDHERGYVDTRNMLLDALDYVWSVEEYMR
jgi:hypothetical protein